MKIIIIEGPDNCGKNTLINEILDTYNCVKIYHCDKPTSDNPFNEQCEKFGELVNAAVKEYHNNDTDVDCIVFNRFYQGEYVYGQLYRGISSESILKMVKLLENKLTNEILSADLIYIQLYSSSPELLMKNEDGQSLSFGKADNIMKEITLFLDIYKFSKITNKYLLRVNNYSEFRDRKSIINEYNKFINGINY